MSSATDPLAERFSDAPTWRVLGVAAGIVLAVLVSIVLVTSIAEATSGVSPLAGGLHLAAVGLPTVLVLYAAGRRFVLQAPAASFLAGRPDRRVIGWVGFGLTFPVVVLGLQLHFFGATWTGVRPSAWMAVDYLLSSLAAGLLAGVLEELAFRGALLRLVEVRWGAPSAIGVTAITFAILHQGHASDGRELTLVLASMLAAGVLLGLIAIRTRSVWNAVAVHAGWNTVFGGQVVAVAAAGQELDGAIIQFHLHEPSSFLAGGDVSLGAAPVTTGLLLMAAAVIARSARPSPTDGWNRPEGEDG